MLPPSLPAVFPVIVVRRRSSELPAEIPPPHPLAWLPEIVLLTIRRSPWSTRYTPPPKLLPGSEPGIPAVLPEMVLKSIVRTAARGWQKIPPPRLKPWLPEIVDETIVLSSVRERRARPPPLSAWPPERVLRSRMSLPPAKQRLPPAAVPKPKVPPPVSVLSAMWRVNPLPPTKATLPPHPGPESTAKTPAMLSEITLSRIVRFSPFA